MSAINYLLPVLLLFVIGIAGHQQTVREPNGSDNICITTPEDFHTPVFTKSSHFSQGADIDESTFTIPLKRAGKLILMEAVVDGISGNIILDTGSTSLVLNSIYFRHGRQQRGLMAGGITGSAGIISRSRVESMIISNMHFHDLEADITDLGHIEAARNIKVLGFAGLCIFSDFEVVIDLHISVMELHRLDHRGNRLLEPEINPSYDLELPIRIESHIVFIDGVINNRRLTFCLDTGAESNVLSIHLPNRVLNSVSVTRRSNLRGAGAQQVEALYGTMDDFSIGKLKFEGMNTIITNLNAMNQAYGTRIDGMLGCDFLEKGIFHINMKKKSLVFFLSATILVAAVVFGQHVPEKAGSIEDGKLVLKISLQWSQEQKARLAELYDLDSLLVNAINSRNFTFINDSTEWTATLGRQGMLMLSKSIGMQTGVQLDHIILSEFPPKAPAPPPVSQATYGVNNFSKKNIFSYQEDLACFVLPGYESAKSVFLSGSFNQWSTMQLPMMKTDTGWTACIALPIGKQLYKFIVDGRWISDPNNRNRKSDVHRGHNSVVFCYNYTFQLDGYSSARRVFLTGSFNGWNTRELQMQKTANGWQLPVYLQEGTHAYKFVIDGNWITDPTNPLTRGDGQGNINSVIAIGDTLTFRLRRFADAERVILSGSFNAWNTNELVMEPYEDGWRLPYVLAAGNYEYKFIVDGRWINDPANPFTTGSGDFTNSFVAFRPNHVFSIEGFDHAKSVIVSGSFNGWSTSDYQMVFRDGEWIFPIHLHPGRYSYKFIVNGEWILDPGNPLWEENEFGTGNSVLWIE